MCYQMQNSKIQQAVEILRQGGVIGYPTETVYGLVWFGLGCDASNEEAIDHIYSLNGKASDVPLLLLIYQREDVNSLTKTLSPDQEHAQKPS